jgi:phospholipid/cholesterol/gamma-HCH transport system substrate-binding protein
VLVGRVSGIHFDNERFQATVDIAINTRYKFPKDSTASILTSGLLGEQYVGLDAGGDSNMLKEGDKVTLTQSAVVLERLIGQFLFSKAAEGDKK